MPIELLIIEDNYHKRERVISFLKERLPNCCITEAHSFTAGCQRVLDGSFSVVLMDMSLPTYDKSPSESGGRFRTFGGREISRKIIRKGINTKILFITQYESFSDKGHSQSLEDLNIELQAECGDAYLGLVHYDSSKSLWKDKIIQYLLSVEK